MTTLKAGIASYEEMKARTMAVARGERRISPGEPKVWFTSTESFAKVLSAGNRELLRVIAEKADIGIAYDGDADRVGVGGGIDDEDIQVLEIGLEELFERLARGLIEDTKLAIGAYWLQNRTSPQA